MYDHNLLTPVVEMARKGPVLAWSPWYLAYSAAWSVVMFTGGLLIFHRTEPRFAEYV